MEKFRRFQDENIYGSQKKLQWIEHHLKTWAKDKKENIKILDVGCGTGMFITLPLGQQGYHVHGIDIDERTIGQAKKMNPYPHVLFSTTTLESFPAASFDVIIASEVLEHVNHPHTLLEEMRRILKPNGRIIVTVPNGYGWFEMEKWMYEKTFLGSLLNRLSKTRFCIQTEEEKRLTNTSNAEDRHLQHFTWRRLKDIIHKASLSIVEASGGTVFSGPLSHFLFHRQKTFLDFNNKLANYLPKVFVSGWYLLLQKNDSKKS